MNDSTAGRLVRWFALVNGVVVPLLFVFGEVSMTVVLAIGALVGVVGAAAMGVAYSRRGEDDDRRPSGYPETLTHPNRDRR